MKRGGRNAGSLASFSWFPSHSRMKKMQFLEIRPSTRPSRRLLAVQGVLTGARCPGLERAGAPGRAQL